jgi:hypothetical protein
MKKREEEKTSEREFEMLVLMDSAPCHSKFKKAFFFLFFGESVWGCFIHYSVDVNDVNMIYN